jgi:hypothetical protein
MVVSTCQPTNSGKPKNGKTGFQVGLGKKGRPISKITSSRAPCSEFKPWYQQAKKKKKDKVYEVLSILKILVICGIVSTFLRNYSNNHLIPLLQFMPKVIATNLHLTAWYTFTAVI